MTITPTGATPAPASALAAAPSAGSADAVFADLVRQHLEAGSDGTSEGLLSSAQAAALLEVASSPSAVPSDGVAALLAGLLAAATAPPQDVAAPGAPAGEAATAGLVVATVPAPGGTAPGAVLPGVIQAPASHVPVGAPAVLVDGGTNLQASPATALVAEPVGGEAGETPGEATAAAAGDDASPVPGAAVAARPADAANAPATTTAALPVGAAGPVGVHGTGAADAPAATGGSSSHPVTDQVFGQVTRLVSRGDGTHRLTLRLHPADLGEVKVVLTVKDGAVAVSLSAGPAAREALRDGSPQLRSLLELAGATTAQVVVRDIAGSAVPTPAGGQGAGQQHAAGADAGDANEQGAGADQTATGGSADGSGERSAGGRGDTDAAPGLSGAGALAGVHVRPGGASASLTPTGSAPVGIPARLDLNL